MGLKKIDVIITVLAISHILYFGPGAFAQEGRAGNGDTTSVEYWRQKGYEARVGGDIELSLRHYMRVIAIDPDDWDANLAVARILFAKGDYKKAIEHYKPVVKHDSTNSEALWGIGRCNYRLGNFSESVTWYQRALVLLPGHIGLMEDLSYGLINSNRSEEALEFYRKIIELDPSVAAGWAGLGRVLLITGKPGESLKHLRKALELDPGNKEIEAILRQAKNQMAFSLGYQFMYINEQEPIDFGSDTAAYNINALINIVTLSKRITDRFSLRFRHLLDNSNREYYQQNDTNRWFDNTSLRGSFLLGNHNLHLFAGGSLEEEKLTNYGLSWDFNKRIRKLRISNTITAGYDYYYYWNQVGHDYISDNLRLTYSKFTLNMNYRYVNVRALTEFDTLGRNPGHQYTITGRYSLFKNPKLTLGIYHNSRNYSYRSPRYWSPQEYKLNGATATVNWESKKGLYTWLSGNIGKYNDATQKDIRHWEASGEIGYNYKTMSYAAGAARFYNPWYENFIAYVSVTKRFIK